MKRTPHPLSGATAANWVRILSRYGTRSLRWGEVLRISGFVAATAPFRWYESLRWHRLVDAVDVREPIFLCGHWQSGQSLAHWLFTCDRRFATLRVRHGAQPAACLTMRPLLRWFLAGRLPKQRISDRMPNDVETPQGDDFALAQVTDVSCYLAYYFPPQADAIFGRSLLMEELPPPALARWKRQFRRLIQKLLLESGSKHVVTRNSSSSTRIRVLLAMFPDARFVFCHRNPYELFAAALERWHRMTAILALDPRPLPADELEQLTLKWYQLLLRRYLADRSRIPEGRLVEVAYDDLLADPVETMQRVYAALGIDDFEHVREAMQRLPQSQTWEMAGGRPLTPHQRDLVRCECEFAFREWGYTM